MAAHIHLAHLPACPFLPPAEQPLTAECLVPHGADRGPGFYHQALIYAQSLWLQGHPARAILLVNRAFAADVTDGEAVLEWWPLPYAAMAWFLSNYHPDQFMGNPRRHWQHLATRMVGPRRELRTWRAWACWHLACLLMPDMPADEVQIEVEGIIEPTAEEIEMKLTKLGHRHEPKIWQDAISWSMLHVKNAPYL